MKTCAAAKRCGSCVYAGVPYEEQLRQKQARAEKLLGEIAPVEPIAGMKDPLYYRNKVHHVVCQDRKGKQRKRRSFIFSCTVSNGVAVTI